MEILRAHYVDQRFSKHFHNEYAVGFIEQGAMAFRYRGQNLVAAKGNINLVVPGEAHDGMAYSDGVSSGTTGPGWRYRMFYLPPEVLKRAAREVKGGVASDKLPYFAKGVLEDAPLAEAICSSHAAMTCAESSLLEKETRLLRTLVNWIARHADAKVTLPRVGDEHRAVRLAREYIHGNLTENIPLDTLARIGGLSPFHFVRVFENALCITPHAYMLQARINYAKNLLKTSSRQTRIADIAADCGFSDQSHLTRQFRRQIGVTPGHYRNIVQNN
ncbi:MAG: helix-turn-helix domain-containing protein [Desulfovibrio sp.]